MEFNRSSVGILRSMLWTWRPRNRSSISGRSKGLFSSSQCLSGCGTHTASYVMISAASYVGGKAAGASKLPLVSTQCPTCLHDLALTIFAFISSLMRASSVTVLPILADRNCVHSRRIFLTWQTFPYMNSVTFTKDLSDFVQRFLISPFSPAPVALPQLCNVLFVPNIIWHLRKAVAKEHTGLPVPVHPSISPHRTTPFPLRVYS